VLFVDLLTYADLELLKARKSGGRATATSSSSSGSSANKRYAILTYSGEFDRVHYPLPLSFEAAPNPDSLLRTVARLRARLGLWSHREPPWRLRAIPPPFSCSAPPLLRLFPLRRALRGSRRRGTGLAACPTRTPPGSLPPASRTACRKPGAPRTRAVFRGRRRPARRRRFGARGAARGTSRTIP
jgi:hypothetical protein